MSNLRTNKELESDINKLKEAQDLEKRARKALSMTINLRAKRIAELENRLLNNVQYEI